ncbi:MAG: alpha/beta hydrolase [Pseudonocardia sp.]|nr:alpha/beta hydrolase [Pseudonocardia sp.]
MARTGKRDGKGAPTGFSSRWRTVGALRLHALRADGPESAPPVVLLPGLVTASRSMVPLARALTRHGLRPWMLDPAGFGYSDKPPRALAISEQADVVAEWLRAEGLVPAPLLGNSVGSQLAAAVAARHAGIASRLVVLSPTLRPALRRPLAWVRLLPRPTGPRDRPGGRRRVRMLAGVHDRLGDEPSLRVLNAVSYTFCSVPRALSTARFAVQEEMERRLGRISAPTLVVRTGRDPFSSSRWARQLVELLPDGRMVRLDGRSHTAFYLAADEVAEVVGPFLAAARAHPA